MSDALAGGVSRSAAGATNPFVGPRPFEETDREGFFGREEEIRQISSLVIARRIVVLYARSGVGKTSLLKAGLIPYLEERKRLKVLPILRVRSDPSDDGLAASQTVTNVYTRGALRFLLGDRTLPPELATMSLVEGLGRYLASLSEGEAATPRLLIVDQFEELFRTHPAFHRQRADFFSQLRGCLDEDPQLSLLLSLREDAVAELDPYAGLLPDRLRSRFRLELLATAPAMQAMQLPIRRHGVELTDAAARCLVDELRRVRIQRPDGSGEEILGPCVEPVHLQVVCHRLWSERVSGSRGDGRQTIDLPDVRSVGSIDSGLMSYYDEQVAAVAATTGTGERTIRDWVDHQLITEHGIRGQVLQGMGDSEGLPNEVVEALVDARLVRCEERRGAKWFELSHDRLVGPARTSNIAWREEHLHPMQRRADLWQQEGRPRSLLLSSSDLRRELAWVKAHDGELTANETNLLAASRRARRMQRLRRLALLVTLLLAGAIWLLVQEQGYRQRELARGLAAQARSRLDERLDLALLLSLEANRINAPSAEVRGSLLAALQYQPRLLSSLHGHEAVVWSVAFSPPGDSASRTRLASGDLKGRILLWDVERRQPAGAALEGHRDGVLSLAFSSDGRYMVSTGRDRKVLRWDLSQDPPTERALRHDLMVTNAAFDPRDDQRLITGDTDGEVSIWDLAEDPPLRRPLGEHRGWVTSLAVDPRGSGLVASGGADNDVRVWHLGRRRKGAPEMVLEGHTGWISGLAWGPAGKVLASVSLDRTVRRWSVESPKVRMPPLEGPADRLSVAAISPDGKVLAAATANGLIHLWDTESGRSLGSPLAGNLALMRGLAFSPDGQILAAGSGSSILLWDVADPEGAVSVLGSPLADGHGAVASVAFHPGGDLVAVAVGGEDAEIRILDALSGAERVEALAVYPDSTHDIAFGPDPGDDTLLEFAADSRFDKIRLWSWTDGVREMAVEQQIPSGVSQDPQRRELLSSLGDFARVLEKALEPKRIEGCDAVRRVAFTFDSIPLAAQSTLIPPSTSPWLEHWDLGAGTSVDRGVESTVCVRSLAFSPAGETIAAGTDQGLVLLLDSASLEPQGLPLRGHLLPVRSLSFSPNGRFLASGSDEGTVHVRDLDLNPERPLALVGHSGSVQAVAFDRRSAILASAGSDRTIILWDVATGIALGRPLNGHRGSIRSLAFSPGGERLVSGGDDGAWLWQLDPEVWRQRACRIANRDLTSEERELFLGSPDEAGKSVCLE